MKRPAPFIRTSRAVRLAGAALRQAAGPDAEGRALMADAMDRLGFSGRAHDRLLRVARTLADLEGCPTVVARHVAEALSFRAEDLTAATHPLGSIGQSV